MGDDITEMWRRRDFQRCSRDLFLGSKLRLDFDDDTISWVLKHSNHIDCFVSQSEGNESIEEVVLYPYSVNGHDYEVLDKVGQSIGNLQALKRLRIANHNYREDDEDLPILDWEILARILSHVRQNIVLVVNITKALAWDAEETRLFARAIHGPVSYTHLTLPTICSV